MENPGIRVFMWHDLDQLNWAKAETDLIGGSFLRCWRLRRLQHVGWIGNHRSGAGVLLSLEAKKSNCGRSGSYSLHQHLWLFNFLQVLNKSIGSTCYIWNTRYKYNICEYFEEYSPEGWDLIDWKYQILFRAELFSLYIWNHQIP